MTSTQIYEVFKIIGKNTVILCHPDTRETDLGFAQPVVTERLVPYELSELEVPIPLSEPLTLEVRRGNSEQWDKGQIEHQSATGLV